MRVMYHLNANSLSVKFRQLIECVADVGCQTATGPPVSPAGQLSLISASAPRACQVRHYSCQVSSQGGGQQGQNSDTEMQGCDMFCPPLAARFTVGTIR